MSAGTVEEIIRKAVVDAEFREALFSDPDKALEGYELTDEEAEKLRGMEPDFFDAQAGELEERISRWSAGWGGGV
jgi:hypothetical protein